MGKDWTRADCGALKVLGRDEEQPRRWRVRWGCCGREMVVYVEYLQSRHRTLPTRCLACVKENIDDSPKAARDRELRALRKATENHPEDYRGPVFAAGLWFGPALGRLGPR